MNKQKDISYLVDEFEMIFQPFAYEGSWKQIEKLLLDYKDFIKQSIVNDIKNGTIKID